MSVRIEIGDVVGLGGAVSTSPEAVRIGPAQVDAVGVSRLRLELSRGAIEIGGQLSGARVELAIARGGRTPAVDGCIEATAVDADRLTLELGERRARAGARLENAVFTASAGGGAIDAEVAVLTDLQVGLGALVLRADAVELDDARVSWGRGSVRVEARAARAKQVTLIGQQLELVLDELALPEGIVYDGDRMTAPLLQAAEVRVGVTLGPRRTASADTADARPGPRVDARLLDLLGGHVAVDVFVDTALPVIGHRRATHRFRLGVEHGTIDFQQVEHGLSGLEDAFLDIELDGDTIVFERDIPLIPGDAKPILLWKLDDAIELALAREHRVRLRRLARFEVAGKHQGGGGGGGKSPVQLRQLKLQNIDAELSMSPAAAVADPDAATQSLEGWLQQASIELLRITGEVAYAAGHAEPPPGTLSISGRAIEATVAGVPMGRTALQRALLRVDALEHVAVVFAGLHPRTTDARARGLSVRDLQLKLR